MRSPPRPAPGKRSVSPWPSCQDVTLASLARGNEAVEFASTDDQGVLVVFRRFSDDRTRQRLRALAREYGLRRILAFGSATRADFRPDSDIDLLVEPVPGHHLGLDERVSLMAAWSGSSAETSTS